MRVSRITGLLVYPFTIAYLYWGSVIGTAVAAVDSRIVWRMTGVVGMATIIHSVVMVMAWKRMPWW